MSTVVNISALTKRYQNGALATLALQDVSLLIEEGEFISISGPSGCGKSTLLNIMGLMDTASGGNYEIAGIKTNGLRVSQRTEIRNKHIGFVFQSFNLIDSLTVEQNVALPLQYRKDKPDHIKERVDRVLDQVGMQSKKNNKPNQLSGGQQQRIAIARAIVGQPDLILVDEPTGNLDSKNGDNIMQLLKNLNEAGSTIVMVTHSRRYAECASRQIQLFDGQIVTESHTGGQA